MVGEHLEVRVVIWKRAKQVVPCDVQPGPVGILVAPLARRLATLRADPARGRALMQENKSYVFFRELPKTEAGEGPIGAQGVSLTPGRSLAVVTGERLRPGPKRANGDPTNSTIT